MKNETLFERAQRVTSVEVAALVPDVGDDAVAAGD